MPRAELPTVDETLCIACQDCVEVCPTECLRLWQSVAVVFKPGACVSCGACEIMCPVDAIELETQYY